MSVLPVNFFRYFSNQGHQSKMVNTCVIDSLIRPRFTSLVAIARIVSTSTMISIIMALMAVVGVIPV
jgi:hypothetical protein